MTIHSIADIVGASVKVPLAVAPAGGAANQRARRIWLAAHGSSNARFGDTNVAAARGVELPADVVVTISASDADPTDAFDLTSVNVYVPTGTTVSASYGI